MRFYYMSQHPKKLHTTFQAAWQSKLYIYIFITITDTSAGKLLVPEGIIRPVVSAATLTWFIRYICY
jgi:hypothetical protein